MLLRSTGLRVFLGIGVTDMRKSIDTLPIVISEKLKRNSCSGDLFVFCNRSRTILKIFYFDVNGFCLWHKRLDKGKFRWPESEHEAKEISMRQLQWLIDGLDIDQPKAHKSINYQSVF